MLPGNLPRSGGSRGGFYEVWYWKLNRGDCALWLRLTLLVRGDGSKSVAEAWGIFFEPGRDGCRHVAVKNTFPIADFSADGGAVRVGECFWADHAEGGTGGRTAGRIRSGGREISWDLRFEPCARAFEHVPRLFRALGLNKSTAITPNPDLRFDGVFRVDGREFACSGAHGMQGRVFGSRQAHGWAWAHANRADDGTQFVFEALTARLKLGGRVLSPPLSALCFELDGERTELNGALDAFFIRSSGALESWEISARKGGLALRARIQARRGDFAGVRYEDTDGSVLTCHNSKVSDLELEVTREGRLERKILCSRSCAYEVVSRLPQPGVEVLI